MAKRITKEERDQRIKELVAAMLAEEAARGADSSCETIDDIEQAMIRISNAVAREVGIQKLEQHTSQASDACACPQCGEAAIYAGRRSRELISSRGNVPVSEAKYRCPACRRDFFPSDSPAGS
jgi:DNA-directed RNA polymerase subunit RPC12/RpoP